MKNSWYYIAAKNDISLTKEAINWKDVRKGLGWGAGLGAIPMSLGLMTGPHGQPNTNEKPTPIVTPQVQPKAQQITQSEPPKIQPNNPIKQEKQVPIGAPSDKELSEFIGKWEGVKNRAYKDTLGNWTIGIGFNLDSPNAPGILNQYGLNKDKLIAGQQITSDQVSQLLSHTLKTAKNDARAWIPNLDSHPKEVQKIIIDMSFNMGGPTLRKLNTTGKLLQQKKYAEAASHMEKLGWYSQTKQRSKNHVATLRRVAEQVLGQSQDKPL